MANGGGNYGNTTNAGVFYSNGNNNTRTNTNTNIGFRSALPHPTDRCTALTGTVPSRCMDSPRHRILGAKDLSPVLQKAKK